MEQKANPNELPVKLSGSALVQVRARFSGVNARLAALPTRQKFYVYTAGAVMIAFVFLALYLAMKPSWRVLYAGLDPQDARELASELTAASIPFDVSPDGTTLKVPAPVLDKARLTTAAKGQPKSGRLGFELFDKPNWVGSEFDERVNYQRALEGELEHTIGSLASVQSARVHLVMPHESLFTEQQREAKASVVLKLRRNTVSAGEGEAIRNLVASAVDGLSPASVVLVDAEGRNLLGPKTAAALQADHEQMLADRLIATLEPITGVGNVRASVSIDYDTSSADEVDESYDPNGTVTLSMQRSEQQSGGQTPASGVPGAQSNAPNAQPPLFPTKAPLMQSLKEESGTYGASKKVRHVIQSSGRVRRITAAVLINDLPVPADRPKGNPKHVAWNPDQLKHIAELSQAVIGYDAARGDLVSVENIAFENNLSVSPGPIERFARIISPSDWLKYTMALIALLMVGVFVLRPAARLFAPPSAAQQLSGSTIDLVVTDQASSADLLPASYSVPASLRENLSLKIAEMIQSDTAQSAQLVHSWIASE